MPLTYLIFDPHIDAPPGLELALTGKVEVSPLIVYNHIDYVLYASYTHPDQTTENLYRPLFYPLPHDRTN